MKFYNKFFYTFFVFLLSQTNALAQKDSSFQGLLEDVNLDDIFGKDEPKKSYLKVSTSYLTNYVYAGRGSDSVNYPYLTPSLEYTHKSGFYCGLSTSFLANKKVNLDLFSLDAGYTIESLGKFSGTVYATKSFYSTSSNNVQNDVSLSVGASVTYDAHYFNLSAQPILMIGTKKDFGLTLSIDRSFYINTKNNTSSLSINPVLSSYFNTVSFYSQNKRRLDGTPLPPGEKVVLEAVNGFQMMNYEFSLPVTYDKNNWGIYLNPTFSVATNPIVINRKVIRPNGSVKPGSEFSATEKISNYFFAELGVYYKF